MRFARFCMNESLSNNEFHIHSPAPLPLSQYWPGPSCCCLNTREQKHQESKHHEKYHSNTHFVQKETEKHLYKSNERIKKMYHKSYSEHLFVGIIPHLTFCENYTQHPYHPSILIVRLYLRLMANTLYLRLL